MLLQAFNIRHLAHAVKAITVEILFRDLLIWSTVNKDGELSNLLKILIRKIQVCELLFMISFCLLEPLFNDHIPIYIYIYICILSRGTRRQYQCY
jgi:hypothetical protein